jgi:hypothetical protein
MKIAIKLLDLRYLTAYVLLLGCLSTAITAYSAQSPAKDGMLVVLVTYGDVDNTPASTVYIEAYGFVRKYNAHKSFVLKSSQPGRYEVALPAGVYDVFVSEGTSEPRCRRMQVDPGLTSTWTLKLEIDEVYTER